MSPLSRYPAPVPGHKSSYRSYPLRAWLYLTPAERRFIAVTVTIFMIGIIARLVRQVRQQPVAIPSPSPTLPANDHATASPPLQSPSDRL